MDSYELVQKKAVGLYWGMNDSFETLAGQGNAGMGGGFLKICHGKIDSFHRSQFADRDHRYKTTDTADADKKIGDFLMAFPAEGIHV